MNRSLSLKINTVIVVMFVVWCVIFVYSDYLSKSSRLQQELEQELQITAHRLQISLQNPLWAFDSQSIGKVVLAEMRSENLYSIFVRDYSGDAIKFGRGRNEKWEPVAISSQPEPQKDLVGTTVTILYEDEAIGEASVFLTKKIAERKLVADLQNFILKFGMLCVIEILILLLLIRNVILSRINHLKNAFQEIEEGNLDKEIEIRHADELADLSRSFDSLRMGIKHKINELKVEIDERKQIEAALIESEKKYRRLVENLHQDFFFYSIDRSGSFQYVSPSATNILGYAEDELPAYCSRYLRRDAYQDTLRPAAELNSQAHWHVSYEVELNHKDGNLVCLNVHEVAVYNEQGQVVAIEGLAHNVTEQKRLESQLRQSQKMEAIGTLAGGIAHDFNNMLAAILGYAEMVGLALPKDSPVQKNIQGIAKAGLRAKELVKHILAFSRKSEQTTGPVVVDQIVLEALKLLRASIPTTIEIHQEIDPECGSIIADPTQIHQVVMNLCTNAAQAMDEEGGALNVAVRSVQLNEDIVKNTPHLKPGRYLQLTVADNGPGIEQKNIEKIFDPYFTTKGIGKGSGMGLAVVAGIVQSHKGMITVESKPGYGARFDVYFPEIGKQLSVEEHEEVKLPTGSESVLVVDDEESIVEITGLRLRCLGYKVTTKTDSVEALKLFLADPQAFDLVISDQTMPNLTGEKLVAKLREVKPDLPIIICTGYSSKLDAEKAAFSGINGFMMKPVDNRELAGTVRKVLDAALSKQ